jgi:hypothetical protein
MCSKGFFRRVVPFFATFLMGVFIASFFVTSGRPSLGGHRHHMEEDRQIRIELDRVNDENDRVTQENMHLREQLGERPVNVERDLIEPGVRGLVPPPPTRLTAPHSIR